jgi:two-component system chemotaxis sensor kinase CheA
MDNELSEFYEEFFDESLEHIENIESILVCSEGGEISKAELDAIFRGVHSVKGGCGMFDFTHLAQFSHNFETLMDEIRQDKRHVTEEIVDVLIEGNDAIKKSIDSLRAGNEAEHPDAKIVNEKILHILSTEAGAAPSEAAASPPVSDAVSETHIEDSVEELVDTTEKETPEEKVSDSAETENASVASSSENGKPEAAKKEDIGAVADQIMEQLLQGGSANVELPAIDAKSADAPKTEQTKEVVPPAPKVSEPPVAVKSEPTPKAVTSEPARQPANTARVAISTESVRQVTSDVARGTSKKAQSTDSIRIVTNKIDNIINQIGELVITKSMLAQRYSKMNNTGEALFEQSLLQLEHNVRELQESIMDLRMVPVDSIFKRFPRLVRDLSKQINKSINLTIEGGETEIDKNMVEKLTDPLVHLMRNAIDHGVESQELRESKGKPGTGTIELKAYHKGGAIIIDIIDDGKGIDPNFIRRKSIEKGIIGENDQLTQNEIYDLIFEPGFSTAETISDISGRGVGMDVVKRNIQELGGNIEISSEIDSGTCFSVRLPLTLSIIDGQLFRIDEQVYIIPITSIIELIQVESNKIKHIAGHANEVLKLRDHYIPIIRLNEVIASQPVKEKTQPLGEVLLIVVAAKTKKIGLFVHELLSQQQVVMKSLEENFKRVKGIPAATILGDGKVALIVDVDGLYELAIQAKNGGSKGANDSTFNKEGVANV